MMTRDRLLQRIALGKYPNFSQIEKKYHDPEVAMAWLKMGSGTLREIPFELITDELRIEAMKPLANGMSSNLPAIALGTIRPSHTERYEEIALLGIKTFARCIYLVDKAWLNNDFMKKALQVNGDALLALMDEADGPAKNGIELTQDLIDVAVSHSSSYLWKFKRAQYSPQAVRQCIKNVQLAQDDYQRLAELGHFEALIDVIKTGWWPNHLIEPEDLSDCVAKLVESPNYKLVYRAYAMTHSIQDLIACMDTPEKRQELPQMYTRADLAPYLKTGPLREDRAFKGRLLEGELGL